MGAYSLLIRERMYLADQPGVGKTPQVVSALGALSVPDTLIVCPKNAIGVWETHLDEWLGVTAKTYVAGRAKYADITSPGVLVTNYEQMKDILARRDRWPVIIFDEAHKLMNRKTLAYKNAKYFSARYLWLVSGTPISKSAADLWAPLAMLAPMVFPAFWPFANKYAFSDRTWGGVKLDGIKDPKRLAADIAPYFLRRLKKDVLPELPVKGRYRIPLHMTPVQSKAYVELVKQMWTEAEDELVLTQSAAVRSIKLRKLLVSPYLLGIDDLGAGIPALIAAMEERGTPTLIGTPFRDGVDLIVGKLHEAGWDAVSVMGGMDDKQTSARVEQFQKGKKSRRAIVSTTANGTAWTATAAQQFYGLEYEWSPQVNNQIEDRMNRFGGTGYECYYFTHMGTIDERVLEVNEGKQTVERLIMDHRLVLDQGRI